MRCACALLLFISAPARAGTVRAAPTRPSSPSALSLGALPTLTTPPTPPELAPTQRDDALPPPPTLLEPSAEALSPPVASFPLLLEASASQETAVEGTPVATLDVAAPRGEAAKAVAALEPLSTASEPQARAAAPKLLAAVFDGVQGSPSPEEPALDPEGFRTDVVEVIELVQRRFVAQAELPLLVHGALGAMANEAERDVLAPEPPDSIDRAAGAVVLAAQALAREASIPLERLRDAAVRGMIRSLGDPFSFYMDAEQAAAFEEELNGTSEGVGAIFGIDDESARVHSGWPGSPAAETLRSGDMILAIDGKPVKDRAEAREALGGPAGTQVSLRVLRKGEELDLAMTRREIRRPMSWGRMLERGVGYLRVTGFRETEPGERPAQDEHAVLSKLLAAGMKSLVIDLRFNPGGSVRTLAALAALFLRPGNLILTLSGPEGEDPYSVGEGGGNLAELPLAVLVNRSSMSASEALAAALQDHRRGPVVGSRTFGKGTTQTRFELRRGILKLTTDLWRSPLGRLIQRTPEDRGGVSPDVEVSLTQEGEAALLRQLVLERLDLLAPGDRIVDAALEAALALLAQVPGDHARTPEQGLAGPGVAGQEGA